MQQRQSLQTKSHTITLAIAHHGCHKANKETHASVATALPLDNVAWEGDANEQILLTNLFDRIGLQPALNLTGLAVTVTLS